MRYMLFLANLFLFRIFILIIVELPSLHITAFVKVLLLCPYVTAQCVFSPDMLNDQKKKRKEKKINRNCMIEILPWPFFCLKLTHCGWTTFLWGYLVQVDDWLERLIEEQGDDLYRMKGVLSVSDSEERYVFQVLINFFSVVCSILMICHS